MARRHLPNWERLRLDYFSRRSPYRLWKLTLSIALPALAAGWIALEASRDSQQIYTSGTMSEVHVQWTNQCSRCHELSFTRLTNWNGLDDRMAMNDACLLCHGAGIGHDEKVASHQATSSDETACSNCHSEHRGDVDLNDVPDRMCTHCHKDSANSALAGKLAFQLDFASFAGHPEFRFRRKNEPDTARIKFNHKVHLDVRTHPPRPDRPVELMCNDCHRAGLSDAEWRFAGQSGVHEPKRMAATQSEPVLQQGYVDTIRYSLHCAQCHPLRLPAWSTELPGVNGLLDPGYVPHDTTAAIRTYLRGQLLVHGSDSGPADPPAGCKLLTLQDIVDREEANSQRLPWINEQIEFVERALYNEQDGLCRRCHDTYPADDLSPPRIVPPDIPMRWLLNASFDHAQHKSIIFEQIAGGNVPRMVGANIACLACHGEAIDSEDTSQVLLPGIGKCRECHGGSSSSTTASAGVSDTCTTCHTYHRAPRRHVPSTSPDRKAGK